MASRIEGSTPPDNLTPQRVNTVTAGDITASLKAGFSDFLARPVMSGFFGLFYAFIWEGFVGSLPGAIQKASIKHYLRSIGSGWVDHGEMSMFEEASGASGSAVVLLILTLFFLVMGAYLFRSKELA